MGAFEFNSTKNSENLETGTNGTEISYESFQKIWKLLISEAFHRNFWERQMESKFPVRNSRTLWHTLQVCSLFSKFQKNVIPFDSGNSEKFHSFLEISGNTNRIFHRMESVLLFGDVFFVSKSLLGIERQKN